MKRLYHFETFVRAMFTVHKKMLFCVFSHLFFVYFTCFDNASTCFPSKQSPIELREREREREKLEMKKTHVLNTQAQCTSSEWNIHPLCTDVNSSSIPCLFNEMSLKWRGTMLIQPVCQWGKTRVEWRESMINGPGLDRACVPNRTLFPTFD